MADLDKLKRRVQRFLARPRVRATSDRANRTILTLLTRNRVIATIGFWLSPFGFNRERWAVLAGRAAYRRNHQRTIATSPQLRRNIHRLEKALIMEPRRSVFALDYIEETVEAFLTYRQDPAATDPTLTRWSEDVLRAYFDTVEKTDLLEGLHGRFLDAAGDALVAGAPLGEQRLVALDDDGRDLTVEVAITLGEGTSDRVGADAAPQLTDLGSVVIDLEQVRTGEGFTS